MFQVVKDSVYNILKALYYLYFRDKNPLKVKSFFLKVILFELSPPYHTTFLVPETCYVWPKFSKEMVSDTPELV